MSELVADCPRCGAKAHTFMLNAILETEIYGGWQHHYEASCACKNCLRSTIFYVSQKNYEDESFFENSKNLESCSISLNNFLDINGHVNLRNMAVDSAPNHTPEHIAKIYKEGAESVAGECPNAAAAMFRLCIDLATKSFIPDEQTEGLTSHVRGKLKPRLNWLFENKFLPHGLEDLSDCIREDGNDGAHDGTITHEEAEDIMEFCTLLLERLYTEPEKLKIANQKRLTRRQAG